MTILRQPWVPPEHTYFYNIPDGERPLEKLYNGLKLPLSAGLGLGWIYHTSRNFDYNSAKTIGKMIYTAFPVVGMGFFYIGGTFIAASIRKKDDELNHVIGVLTAAPLVRKLFNFHTSLVVVTYAALLVAFLKNNAKEVKNAPEKSVVRKGYGSGVDWYLWSKNKPADASYLTYSLFK